MNAAQQMIDKVVLITGATDGIGKVTAEALASQGAEVLLVGRNQERAETAVEDIRKMTGNLKVSYLLADLSVQAQVRALAEKIRQRCDRLDVLVNNAGAVFMQRRESADGIEMTWALNHMAYFLLTDLLSDCFHSTSRVVNVSSAAHTGGRIKLGDVQLKFGYSGWKAYSQSKLANILFTYELARRWQGRGITVNALHPGFVATNFGKSNGGIFGPIFQLFQVAAISPQKGAETSIYLASAPEMAGVSGKYFDQKKPVRSSPISYDETLARKVWQLSEEMLTA